MKKILFTLSASLFTYFGWAQCSIVEIPLSSRAASSDLIVEGKVTGSRSFWNAPHNMIYTANTVEIYKVFKGSVAGTGLEVLTVGGTVGMDRIVADPSLQLHAGETGVFTLEQVSRFNVSPANRTSLPQYEAYASVQGFVKYDLASSTASDPFRTYTNIETEVYNAVLPPYITTWQTVIPFDIHASGSTNKGLDPQQMAPSISGFSPTTVTAGTSTQLTITGSGFGSTQGSGTVGFKNADDGGASYTTALPTEIVSWSNTQIVVKVPSAAGTGTIQVTQGTTATSSGTLTVSWANLNVQFDPGSGTEAYHTDHVNDNGSGGYTWQMNTSFASNSSASASFMRAFNNWRCNTGINWTIGSNTSINDAVSDGTNCICFDNTAPLSSGILGVCYSYWSGCASGPNIVWYVNELDIIFDDGSNISPLTWQYGPSLPTSSQYDFESVAVHELGHGHQLGHVIASGQIMHYALSNGGSNRTPSSNDLSGANFVQSLSVAGNICGPGAMTSYTCVTAPVADFSGTPTSVCAGNTVSFSDLSTNTPTSWAWTFTGGTPSSSTSQNPTITYNTPGTYAVSLVATNSAGSDTKTVSAYITVTSCSSAPVANFSGSPTSLCAGGSVSFSDLSTNTPTSWAWTFTGGTPSSSTSQNPTITYNTPGTYAVSLVATNSAGSDTKTVSAYITVNANPSASGSATNVSCNGAGDGSIDLTPSGGQSPYTFVWSPSGQTTEDRSSLSPGTYSVTVTDNNGCTVQNSFAVTQPTALSVGMSKTDASCANNNGTATATPSGGTSPYFYVWSPGGQTTQTATGLSAGTYTCTVTDNNGCNLANTVTVNTSCTTQLASGSCGITLTSLNQWIYCVAVTGATDYRYRFICVAQGFNQTIYRGSSANDFKPAWQTGIQNNRTYTVEVSAKVGSSWTAWGAICNLTTPASVQGTYVLAPYCPGTTPAVSTTIYCNPVTNATDYRWRVTNTALGYSSVKYRGAASNTWKLTWSGGILTSTTYNVEVAALVSGIWGSYSTVCQVTTGATQLAPNDPSTATLIPAEVRAANPGAYDDVMLLDVFPNPTSGTITVTSGSPMSEISVFNILGTCVYHLPVGRELETSVDLGGMEHGVYFIHVLTADGAMTRKIVVQ
jgi:PKD repeat protein